jgi:hypothetical protein
MKYIIILGFLFIFCGKLFSQNIKSIQLRPLQENNFSSIVPLGTVLELSFDDLDNDNKEYQYKIQHMTHDWQPSRLLSSQYIDGFDQNNINTVANSFNTFENYTHYTVQIPNRNSVITKSGNYLLSVLNDDDEVVFSRRFVLYENEVTVGVNVTRSRNAKTIQTQQTVEFVVSHPKLRINNPSQEVNVVILKNENWDEKIVGIQPTFYQQNVLRYSYNNNTNFWGGNEYLNFDTKILRNRSLNIVKIERKDIFHHYLYPNEAKTFETYRYNPDINGQFALRTLEGSDTATEADYAMMHFTLVANEPYYNKDVYIYGAFNNFQIEEETKLLYNATNNSYEGAILLKQGFYNYLFVTVDKNNVIDKNEIMGSYFETENEYKVLFYFKAFGALYDRVVGVGMSSFSQNR